MIDPERIGAIIGETLLPCALGALRAVAGPPSTSRPLAVIAILLGAGAWRVARNWMHRTRYAMEAGQRQSLTTVTVLGQ